MMADPAEFVMPKLGLTMTEGRIARWVVPPGAHFAAGDVIVEIETDKIVNEVEAPSAGTLIEYLEPEGATTAVGAPIARWEPDGLAETPPRQTATPPAAAPAPAHAPAETTRHAAPSAARGRTLSTPYARKLAKGAGLELASISGTGPRGRIKAADVEQAVRLTARPLAPAPEDAARAATPLALSARAQLSLAIADVDVGRLHEIERSLATSLQPLALEPRHCVALAGIRALTRGQDYREKLPVGFEFMTADGPRLLTIFADPRLSLSALVAQMADVERRASQGRLRAEETGGGRLLILAGNHVSRAFGPAVPPGWTAAIGVGSAREVLRPGRGARPLLAREMTLALSYDAAELPHVAALDFLAGIKALLEEPFSMLVS